ncbi:efflux transporter outer membrane subunit [Novipirellula caenicola]|uniref:Cation efflux system protein CusC n=1 Tax=Novipirellula caenicola TaxID=1536901 RepID=A0ABP9VTJ9_9BACT
MNLLKNVPHTKLKNVAISTAVVTSFLVVLPSCSVPPLRRAQPGPMMPENYNLNTQWIHGASAEAPDAADPDVVSASDATSPPDNLVDADDSSSESKSLLGSFKLASFVKPATALELNEADDSAVNTSPVKDQAYYLSDLPGGSGVGPNPMEIGYDAVEIGISNWENSSQVPRFEFFNDPYLTGLIHQALTGNQELKILNEEIRIASNEVQARSGEYLPFVTLGGGAGVEKSSAYSREGAVEEHLDARGKSFPDPLPDFLVATNVSWEIDIWRKLRNARDAACLRYLGSVDGRNYIVTRMVAEVAENYFELLALDNQLLTLDKTIEIQQRSLETSQQMKDAGRGTELAVQRFLAEVQKNESEKLIIQQRIVEAENRINFLLGRYPQPVQRSSVEYIDLNLHSLSAGVPAQLLRNRSDIRQAEREVAAAGLDVKVARARFYPSLNLSAGVGYRAFDAGYLFSTPESLIYNVAGDLVAPLINKKAIKAAYRSANAQQLQAVYDYQRTVLNAYTEVVNQLTKVDNYAKSIEIKKQQLESLEASVDSATKLFQNARAEYMEVLLAQRDMMEAKMVLIETKQEQLAATVNAYQALGGGGAVTGMN